MRLGLAVFGAAAVLGGYTLVSSLGARPAPEPPEATAPAPREAPRLRAAAPEGGESRTYELIRYVAADGSLGMVDDPRRVPPGARIVSRERKTVPVARPAEAPDADAYGSTGWRDELEEERRLERILEERRESGRRLTALQRQLMEKLAGAGWLPGADAPLEVQQDLDAMQREADRMNDCADGDCPPRPEPAASAAPPAAPALP